jgi:hypothetical protein
MTGEQDNPNAVRLCPWCGRTPCLGYYCPGYQDPDYQPLPGWDEFGEWYDPEDDESWMEDVP